MNWIPIEEFDKHECPDGHETLFWVWDDCQGYYIISGWRSMRAFRSVFHVTLEGIEKFCFVEAPER